MSLLVLLAAGTVVCNAAAATISNPYGTYQSEDIYANAPDAWILEAADNRNVIVAPNNCPSGQQFINGQCRDVWRNGAIPRSAVAVPDNCRPPQQFVNGRCRDVWVMYPSNVIVTPNNCPTGQQFINGQCRDVWRGQISKGPFNIVTVPPNCPDGQEYINGQCRDVWGYLLKQPYNVITVPPNCPEGQEYINGQCRDVWIKQNKQPIDPLNSKILASIQNSFKRSARDVEDVEDTEVIPTVDDINRNIISVPNQCSSGSRPDALGICRPTFD